VVTISLVGFIRNNFRDGTEINWGNFDSKVIVDSIIGNFRIYKTYYGVIKAVPNLTPYLYGRQMIIYTIIMFVPRALWPTKPTPPGEAAIVLGVSKYANMAGTVYPNIGEFYYEFGVFGIILFMYLFGTLLRKSKKLYSYQYNDVFRLMIYSLLLP